MDEETLSTPVNKPLYAMTRNYSKFKHSPSRASRAVSDGSGARGDSHHLGAVDGGLLGGGLSNSSHRRGDQASSKDHGTHFGGF